MQIPPASATASNDELDWYVQHAVAGDRDDPHLTWLLRIVVLAIVLAVAGLLTHAGWSSWRIAKLEEENAALREQVARLSVPLRKPGSAPAGVARPR